jgi:glycosyltransferase involved in cell wall biosynthesis
LSKCRILYVHHDGIITGSIISLRNLIAKLDRDKFEPFVLLGSDGPARNLFEASDVEIFIGNFRGLMLVPPPSIFSTDYYYNWKSLLKYDKKKIIKILKQLKPDIVHLNDISVLVPGEIAHKMGIKTVWHIRCSMAGKKSFLQYLIAKNMILRNSDYIVSISEDELEDFKKFENSTVIYNGIQLEESEKILREGSTFRKEFNIKDDEIAVGMIGNLNKQKGAWNFIKAAGIVKKKCGNVNFRFFIVAPIPGKLNFGIRGRLGLINTTHPFERAKKLLAESGLSNSLDFTNRRNDVLNVMAGLDIVSACYNLHAIGRPGFEASSVGKPVIVNKGLTGKSNLVLNGITGLVINKENPVELADAIITLAKNKDLRILMGNKGMEHVRNNINSDKNILNMQAIYLRLMQQISY